MLVSDDLFLKEIMHLKFREESQKLSSTLNEGMDEEYFRLVALLRFYCYSNSVCSSLTHPVDASVGQSIEKHLTWYTDLHPTTFVRFSPDYLTFTIGCELSAITLSAI